MFKPQSVPVLTYVVASKRFKIRVVLVLVWKRQHLENFAIGQFWLFFLKKQALDQGR
jgi:hypothetical protein